MLFAAWSEGAVYNNQKDFETYVKTTAIEYNNPIETAFIKVEERSK